MPREEENGDDDRELWEVERVWTHRDTDRTTHYIEARDKQEAERRLECLERAGETDDLGNEIESQAGNPLHVHVFEPMDVGSPQTGGDAP